MRKTLFQTFAAPLVLLGATVVGLIVGVVADGWLDAMAVAALMAPLLAIAISLWRPRRAAGEPGSGD